MAEQPSLEGVDDIDAPSMIVRVSATAVKIAAPFMAKNDIRYYMNGINIRPLVDGGVMLVATSGAHIIVVRDVEGFAEREIVVSVMKDGLKYATNQKITFDVMSNGRAMIVDESAQPLFIQPNNSLIEGHVFPRVENIIDLIGYKPGLLGAVNPAYLADALDVGSMFRSIQFYSRPDNNSPLIFTCGDIAGIDCMGCIARLQMAPPELPKWIPERKAATNLGEV